MLVGEQAVGGDHLAGREAHDLAGEVAHRHLADLELAGREVERGERDHGGCAGAGFRAREDGGQVVARLRIEQAVLGERAGRDEAHHVAAHDRLGAPLPRLRRVLELLAHGDAEALADQALQVFVGAVDRHPAHGDVLAQMLAALGEHDAERLGGGDGVGEEQLVEVAHAVEQHAVGIGGLDLQELRHRRRDAGGRAGIGRLRRRLGSALVGHGRGRVGRLGAADVPLAPVAAARHLVPLAAAGVGIAFPRPGGNLAPGWMRPPSGFPLCAAPV